MRPASKLNKFLSKQASEGSQAGQGQFTIAREVALEKIAQFQLPFPDAWLLKLVQAAVSADSESLEFTLNPQEVWFYFGQIELTCLEAEEAFFNPQSSGNAAFDHLRLALWVLALHEKAAFELHLSHWSSSLIWDGKALVQSKDAERVQSSLIVSFANVVKTSSSWFTRLSGAGSRNAGFLMTLKNKAFTCPVPLTVDGRRLDSLHECPRQEPLDCLDYTVALGFAHDSEQKHLRVPPATMLSLPEVQEKRTIADFLVSKPKDPSGYQYLGKRVFAKIKKAPPCFAPFLILAHRNYVKPDFQKGRWEPGRKQSLLYWVKDGVVIQKEPLTKYPRRNSITTFVSAAGLATDFSTFTLTDSEERFQRAALARTRIRESLDSLTSLDLSLIENSVQSEIQAKVLGGGAILFGVASIWANPLLGLGMMGGGALALKKSATRGQTYVEEFKAGLEVLQSDLRS